MWSLLLPYGYIRAIFESYTKMSWFIKSIGLKGAVKNDVLTSSIPQGLKDAVVQILDEKAPGCPYDSAWVEGSGHFGDGCGGSLQIKVEQFNAAVAPLESKPITTLSAIEQQQYDAGRALALEGKPQPDDASDAAKRGYASVPPSSAAYPTSV